MLLKLTVKYLPTSTIAANINGAVKPNSTRQCVWSMMMPDSVGPIAGAAVNIMVITPIAVPRLLGGKIDNTPLNRSGTKNAADTACTIRPTTKIPKVGANTQISDPAKNVACVNSTILRVSNH